MKLIIQNKINTTYNLVKCCSTNVTRKLFYDQETYSRTLSVTHIGKMSLLRGVFAIDIVF